MVSARQRSCGFMLLAAMVVFAVVALGIFLAQAGIIQVGSSRRIFSTQNALTRIEDSLVQFAAIRERLPCPANPALDASNAAAGYANADAAGTSPFTNCTYPVGVVPWRTLGLTIEDVIDPWGRLFTYRVYDGTIGLTRYGGASAVYCDTDNGTVPETAPINGLCASDYNTLKASFMQHSSYLIPGNTKGLAVTDFGTAVTQVAYALISHGPSGLGGYLSTGARMALPGATAADYPNTQVGAASIVKAAISASTVEPGTAGHFDDIVAYRTIDDLVKLARLDARNWPEVTMPTFTVATTSSMTTPSSDAASPHFMSTGDTAASTAFTAQQVSFGGGSPETVVYGGAAAQSFGECLWWPLKLTMNDGVVPRALSTYLEFAAVDNVSDPFSGITLGFLSGNDALGAPNNGTCGTTGFYTTATGSAGSFTVDVADPTNIVQGLRVVGTGIGTGGTGTIASVTAVAGNTITLTFANSAAVAGPVYFADSRLIRRDIGWAGGSVSAYANRFAIEFDANIDTGSAGPPVTPSAFDPTQPHLAIDYAGVTHGSDAESCATNPYGSGCNMPPLTFPLVSKAANLVSSESTITVADVGGIAHGMPVSGFGIGPGATVIDIQGTTISLGTSAVTSVPVLNTATGTFVATFSSISSANFMQNRLSVFHSIRADLSAQACVLQSGTTGALGANTLAVASAAGIAPGMGIYGQNVARGVTVTNVTGTTITLSDNNVGAVNERITFALLPSTTKAATGSSGFPTIIVSDNRGIGVGMTVTGGGVGTGAKVTNVSGTAVTLSVANSSAVSGTLTFTVPAQLRTATGASGQNQIDISDATGIAVGMVASGLGIGSGATVTGIAGTTLTLSAVNSSVVSGAVTVRPAQTLVKAWALSSAGCNADAATCNALKDVYTPFGVDMTANSMALHAVTCITTPTPSNAFNDLYFGVTSSNRTTNVLTGAGANFALRRLTVNSSFPR